MTTHDLAHKAARELLRRTEMPEQVKPLSEREIAQLTHSHSCVPPGWWCSVCGLLATVDALQAEVRELRQELRDVQRHSKDLVNYGLDLQDEEKP